MKKPLEAVMALVLVTAFLIVGGILLQSLRDSQGTQGKAFEIADAGLNATQSAAAQSVNAGTIVGVLFLVIVAVALLLTLVPIVKKFSGGGGKGGNRGGGRRIVFVR